MPQEHQNDGRGRGKPRGSASGRGKTRGRGRGNYQTGTDEFGGGPSENHGDVHGHEGREKAGHTSDRTSNEEVDHGSGQVPDLDADFLAALPPDIREELESAHRLEVMKNRQKQAELAAEAKIRQTAINGADPSVGEQMGTPPPTRPTLMGLRDTDELRGMLAEWVQSTLIQEEEEETADTIQHTNSHAKSQLVLFDEGPNPEDVQSFSNFISRVIFMEKDLERVQLLLRYLRRKVEENERQAVPTHLNPEHVRVLMTWQEALTTIVDVAQSLVSQLYGGSLLLD